jgi:hypothetical protein
MYEAARQWRDQVDEAAKSFGTNDEFLYMNFAGQFQNPFSSYGKENVDHLNAMAHKYDPAGVFQSLVPGGFKLKK